MHSAVGGRLAALFAELVPTFRKKIADQAEVVCEQFLAHFRNVPSRQIGVDAIHEGCVVAHFRLQRAKQMPHALLVLHIDIEIANHHDAALGPDAFLASAELARLHVAFHDVDAVFLIERNAGDFIEADHIVLADEAALAVGVVYERARHGGLTSRNEMGVW